MGLRLITSTEAENIAVLKNAFEDLRLKTDALNEKLNYDADAGLNLFSEVLDCALALLSAIQDVDASELTHIIISTLVMTNVHPVSTSKYIIGSCRD